MSLIASLHQARKARLQRIAARAAEHAAHARLSSLARGRAAGAKPAAPHGGDRDYERAWAFEILGLRDVGDLPPRKLKVEDIQRATALHFGVDRSDIVSTRHARDVARPRQLAMYLARQLTAKSYPDIGRRFGGRDHSTVLRAVRQIEELLAHDGGLADAVSRIRAALANPQRRP
jgi:hypothetical protein